MSQRTDQFPSVRVRFRRRLALAALAFALALAGAWAGDFFAATRAGAQEAPSTTGGAGEDARERTPAELFAEAERLCEEGRADSFRVAAEKYEAARRLWREAGDRASEARAARGAGDVYFRLSKYREALDSYDAALALYRAASDRAGEAETLNGVAHVYIYLGEYRKSVAHSRRALSLNARRPSARRVEAQSLTNLADAFYYLGELGESLKLAERALGLWEAEGDLRGQARATSVKGSVHNDRGEMDKAAALLERALSLWRAVKDPQGEASALDAQAAHYNFLGEYQSALDLHDRALKIFQTVGDRNGEAVAHNGLGYTYLCLGKPDKALAHYARAADIYRELSNSGYEGVALANTGDVYSLLGDNPAAVETYGRALALLRAAGDRQWEGLTLNSLGAVYLNMNELERARAFYEQALPLLRAAGNQRWEANTLNGLGVIRGRSGRKQEALEFYRKALPLARAAGDRVGESLARYNIARAEGERGNLALARAEIEASIGIVESLRAGVASQELRASYFASVHKYYETYIDLLMRLHKQRPAEGFDVAALQASERARARSLVETLAEARAEVRQGVEAELLRRAEALQQQLGGKTEQQMRLLSRRHTREEAEALAEEIRRSGEEYEHVKAQIRARNPRYAELTQPRPLNLLEIQGVLDANTLVLEYALGDERSYLWVVSKDRLDAHELPGRAQLEGAAAEVRRLLTARQPVAGETGAQAVARVAEADALYGQRVTELSRMLLEPVAARLGDKRLLVVFDGALQYVPFQLLVKPNEGRGDSNSSGDIIPLVVEHEIVNLPSASVLAALRRDAVERRPAPKAVAVLADPVFESDDPRLAAARAKGGSQVVKVAHESSEVEGGVNQVEGEGAPAEVARLPASEREAEAVMGAFPGGAGLKAVGFDASKATALGPALKQYSIIHLATHGVVSSERPESSGLILSRYDREGRRRDGFLRLGDIYNLDLPAELVVLSACDTALGQEVKGEGLIGLTRGFMYAGAPRVVASLWKVDDEATAALMKSFYEGMVRERLTPAAALRRAQISMLRHNRWRAPYYWAAFVIQGEYEGRINFNAESPSATALGSVGVGALALTLFAGGFYFIRRRRGGRVRRTAGDADTPVAGDAGRSSAGLSTDDG